MTSIQAEQPINEPGTAGVAVRPPVLLLGGLLLGLVLDRLLPVRHAVDADLARWITGAALIALGLAFFTAGIRDFTAADTPVPTNQPTRALVTTGAHGWSRNPIYVGMFAFYAGIGVAAASPWILILLLPLALTIRYGVVAHEETYLEGLFGDAYRDYKSRVRRWL